MYFLGLKSCLLSFLICSDLFLPVCSQKCFHTWTVENLKSKLLCCDNLPPSGEDNFLHFKIKDGLKSCFNNMQLSLHFVGMHEVLGDSSWDM